METRHSNPDNDLRGLWTPGDLAARSYFSAGVYPAGCPSGRVIDDPPPERYWSISNGAATLIACFDDGIAAVTVELLALGIADWHKELGLLGESTVLFRDSAFAEDVAKTNLTAILQQRGLENARSL